MAEEDTLVQSEDVSRPETATGSQETTLEKRPSLFWAAFNVLAMDMGITVVVLFFLGFVSAFIYGEDLNLEMVMQIGIVLGALASMYAGYILHHRFTTNVVALVYVCLLMAVFALIGYLTPLTEGQATYTQAVGFVMSLASYGIGWIVSEKTGVQIPIPGRRLLAVAKYIGYVLMFLTVLSLAGVLLR